MKEEEFLKGIDKYTKRKLKNGNKRGIAEDRWRCVACLLRNV